MTNATSGVSIFIMMNEEKNTRKMEALNLRLSGLTYAEIAQKLGISRQRVQQIIAPPKYIRDLVVGRAHGRCEICGIFVGKRGHVHHNSCKNENYNDVDNLELLCISCHILVHNGPYSTENVSRTFEDLDSMNAKEIKEIRTALKITQAEMARRLKCTPDTVSHLELGKTRPSKSTIRKLERQKKKARGN